MLLIILHYTEQPATTNHSPAPVFHSPEFEKPYIMYYFIQETEFSVLLSGTIFFHVSGFTLPFLLLSCYMSTKALNWEKCHFKRYEDREKTWGI